MLTFDHYYSSNGVLPNPGHLGKVVKKIEEVVGGVLKEIRASKTARLKGLNLTVTEKQFQDSVDEQMLNIEEEVNSVIKASLVFLKKLQNTDDYKRPFRAKIYFFKVSTKTADELFDELMVALNNE